MARKRRPTPHTDALPKPPAPPADPTTSPPGVDSIAAIALALVGIAWLWLFVGAERLRVALLFALLTPELIVGSWFGNYQQPLALLDRWPLIAVAGLLLLAAHELGYWVLRATRAAEWLSGLERVTLAIGVGLNLVSLYTLLIGLAGLLPFRWLIVGPIVLAAAVTAVRLIAAIRRRLSQRTSEATAAEVTDGPRFDRLAKVLLGLATLIGVMIVLGAMLPPIDFDVREYHLQVPKEWWREGRVSFLPHNIYGNMPLGAEMQTLAAMAFMPGDDGWWLGALAGKLTMACYAPLTAALLVAAGIRWFTPRSGALAAAIFMAQPWIAHTAVTGLNEPAVTYYVLAAIYVLCLSPLRPGLALLCGFLAGGAAACKYPAVIYAVLPLGLAMFAAPTSDEDQPRTLGRVVTDTLRNLVPGARWGIAALFAAGVLLGCGPWYAKNAALTGNPVYPLAYDLFGGETRTPEKNAQWQRAHQVPRNEAGARYSLAQLRSAGRKLFFEGVYTSPLLLPLLLVVGMAAATRWLRRSNAPGEPTSNAFALAACIWLVLITAVWWFATHRIERFWLPALPLAAILAAQAPSAVTSRGARGVVTVFILIGVFYGALAAASPLVGDSRWFVALDALRNSNLAPARRWLNENTQPGQRVLLVGDAEPFELVPKAYYNTCFDDSLLAGWSVGRSARQRREALESRDIAFVYVDWNEIGRYLSPGNYGYDPRWTPELLLELIDQQILAPVVALSDDGQALIDAGARPKPGEQLRPTIYRVIQPASGQ